LEIQIGSIPDDVKDSVVPVIERHTVLLLHLRSFAGSGTLVRSNNAYGILTARHVPEGNRFDFTAGRGDELGLCFAEKTTAFMIPMDHLTKIDIGIPKNWNGKEVPDLAFLKIPSGNHLSTIAAKRSFWNLDYDRQSRMEICASPTGAMCLSYHAAERTIHEVDELGNILFFPASVGWSGVKRTFEVDAFDYCEMGVDAPDEKKGIPNEFKGASGGGIWKVPLIGNEQKIKAGTPVLSGVIFYQTAERTILAHGPKSIYERVYETLQAL
jgi:hypothetical protein